MDGSVLTWSLDDDRPFTRLHALFQSNLFTAVAYHPDESQLLTCGTNRQISWWDSENDGEIRTIPGSETGPVTALHISASGEYFVSGSDDKLVKLWNYDEGSQYYEGVGHSSSVNKVRFSPDGQRIVSTGSEGGIFVWKTPPGIY